jgi:hypothetical protein
MPCYRCGTRQVDPDRGESPWKRGVRADRQVLICPACQSSFDWMAELDRCPVCVSAQLVRRLGEVECRDCGCVRQPASGAVVGGLAADAGARADPDAVAGSAGAGGVAGAGGGMDGAAVPDGDPTPGLAEEVERALERVLGRTRRTAGIG